MLPSARPRKMNSHQTSSIALNLCKKLANTMWVFSDDDFYRKLAQRKELKYGLKIK